MKRMFGFWMLALSACTAQVADDASPVAAPGENIVDTFAAQKANATLLDVEIPIDDERTLYMTESTPGLVDAWLEGPEGDGENLGDSITSLTELYEAAAGDAGDAAVLQQIRDAEARAEELSALLAESPPPAEDAPTEGDQKYYNPNGCLDARSYWTDWFHDNKCTNGGDFGSGWQIDTWPGVCNSLERWYDVNSLGRFAVNFDGVMNATCSEAYAYYYYWTGSYWRRTADLTLFRGTWNSWWSTARFQKWRLEGASGQCRQVKLYGCFLEK